MRFSEFCNKIIFCVSKDYDVFIVYINSSNNAKPYNRKGWKRCDYCNCLKCFKEKNFIIRTIKMLANKFACVQELTNNINRNIFPRFSNFRFQFVKIFRQAIHRVCFRRSESIPQLKKFIIFCRQQAQKNTIFRSHDIFFILNAIFSCFVTPLTKLFFFHWVLVSQAFQMGSRFDCRMCTHCTHKN